MRLQMNSSEDFEKNLLEISKKKFYVIRHKKNFE